jgi:hypothetical protein
MDLTVMKATVAAAGAREAKRDMDLPVQGSLNSSLQELEMLKVRDAVEIRVKGQMAV